MSERGCWRRVGQVISWYVNSLYRRDGSVLVLVIRSCKAPKSVAKVGWYPTADGIRPSKADTSEQACVKRKMLSTNNNTSCPSTSRKYSATVKPVKPTRALAPEARSWPYTSTWNRRHRRHSRSADNARLDHFVVQVISLAGTLADTGENRVTPVASGNVVDQLHNNYSLPTPAPPKRLFYHPWRMGQASR